MNLPLTILLGFQLIDDLGLDRHCLPLGERMRQVAGLVEGKSTTIIILQLKALQLDLHGKHFLDALDLKSILSNQVVQLILTHDFFKVFELGPIMLF